MLERNCGACSIASVVANDQKVLKHITQLNLNRILLGLTATSKRMNEAEHSMLNEMYHVDKNISNKVKIRSKDLKGVEDCKEYIINGLGLRDEDALYIATCVWDAYSPQILAGEKSRLSIILEEMCKNG